MQTLRPHQGRLPAYGGHPASRGYTRGHARSSSGGGDVAPITIEEYLNLVPTNPAPPIVLTLMLQYRSFVEGELQKLTPALLKRAEKLRAKGLNIPDRFMPQRPAWTREDVLRVARDIYLELLTQRYASPGGPATA